MPVKNLAVFASKKRQSPVNTWSIGLARRGHSAYGSTDALVRQSTISDPDAVHRRPYTHGRVSRIGRNPEGDGATASQLLSPTHRYGFDARIAIQMKPRHTVDPLSALSVPSCPQALPALIFEDLNCRTCSTPQGARRGRCGCRGRSVR
jgi:hypothetical protein